MKAMDLLEAMGSIRDKYILAAREERRKQPHPLPYSLAAILALVLICAVLLQTPMGAAAVETVKEAVTHAIDRLFPPKDVIVPLEGNPSAIPHEAQGREPTADTPGFAIYVDTSMYYMEEDGPVTYIRPTAEFSNPSLPPCEIEISHTQGQNAQSAARFHWEGASLTWDNAGEIRWTDTPPAWVFSLWEEGGADARQETHYFVDDGQDGAFHIVSRCFQEAVEGHGTRFASMIQSFQVVTHEETAGSDTSMEDIFAQAKAQNTALVAESAGDITAGERTELARRRRELWLDTLESLWLSLDSDTQNRLFAGQLDWSVNTIAAQEEASAQFGGGEAGAESWYGTGARLLEERCGFLLAAGAEIPGTVAPCAEEILVDFVTAYFAGDTDAMEAYLTTGFCGPVAGYPYETTPVLDSFKNLGHPIRDMASQGYLTPSVQFRETGDSDSFTYLSVVLKWENGSWKIDSYGLEG